MHINMNESEREGLLDSLYIRFPKYANDTFSVAMLLIFLILLYPCKTKIFLGTTNVLLEQLLAASSTNLLTH